MMKKKKIPTAEKKKTWEKKKQKREKGRKSRDRQIKRKKNGKKRGRKTHYAPTTPPCKKNPHTRVKRGTRAPPVTTPPRTWAWHPRG
ncbi:hypothetical protein, partial [Erwinia amylovora]|uniref:hypothetical protein n=1 Tax=Erwinia amylovora TaxID=552 RepID=UPI00196B2C55